MAALSLHLLGPFTATLNDQPLYIFKTSKVQALLIYLAVERDHPHRRETVFTLLWPGMPEKSARHNLSQTIYALRQTFPEVPSKHTQETVPLILTNRQTLQIHPDAAVDADIHQLDDWLVGTKKHEHQRLEDCPSCISVLEKAAALYRGDFLSDFYLEDSNSFEEWSEAVREAHRRKANEILATLSDIAIYKREYEQALQYIDSQIVLDNLAERAHYQKIDVLARCGQRVEAMRQYREYTQRLTDELMTVPSGEITALYERIQSEDLVALHPKPAISKLVAPRHNLRQQATPFIGRQKELDQLDDMLSDPNIRLITIVGPGGMGKTRLAIACAQRQLESESIERKESSFSDGIFFVPLADLDTPDQIPEEIATSLGLEFSSGEIMHQRAEAVDPNQQILAYLENRNMLLVLDNFEHLRGGEAFLAELLKSAPSTRLLVTSRERISLHEEHLYPITGLTFPGDEEIQDYRDYTAFQLFRQCAKRLQPDYAIASGDLGHLTSICQLLDGMPLGLELAASWVDLLTTREIAVELQQGLDFLESDLANIPKRHRSLAAVCNSTWGFLNSTQQTHLESLSVFRGGFTRRAAEQVLGISLRSLGTLVKKSLLQFSENEVHYRFHPFLRQFAAQKLAENPKDEFKVRDAHSAYFCAVLHTNQQTHEAGQPHIAVRRTEKEYANIQAAWILAVDQLNLERIYQGLDGLCLFYDWGGRRIYEGLTTCQYVNRKLAKSDHKPTIRDNEDYRNLYEKIHAKVMLWEGEFNYFYNPVEANRLFEKSRQKLTKLRKSGYDVRLELGQHGLWWFNHLAKSTQNTDFNILKSLLLDSLSLLQDVKNDWWQYRAYSRLMFVFSNRGLYTEAWDWAEQGYARAKKQNNYYWETFFLNDLGTISRAKGEYDAAIKYFSNALLLANSYQLKDAIGINNLYLGHLHLFLGRLDDSIQYFQRDIQLTEGSFDSVSVSWSGSSTSTGIAQWLVGEFENAEKTISSVVNLTKNQYNTRGLYPNISITELLTITGRYREAEGKIDRANIWLNNINIHQNPFMYGRLLRILGWIALVNDQYTVAQENLEASIECFQYDPESSAWSQPYLGLVYYKLGDREKAKRLIIESLSTAIDMQAYIPLVFILPITLPLLAEEDIQNATKVYTQIRRDRFMSKAQLFSDLAYRHLPEEITSIPVKTVEHNAEHREALWNIARFILLKLD